MPNGDGDKRKLLELLQGAQDPLGAGDLLGGGEAPIGTDAVPTEGLAGSGDELPTAGPGEPEGGIEAILGAPDMTPEERMKLQAELALAARQRFAGGFGA